MEIAETIAEELAGEHFERCYGEMSCEICADDTPLSGTMGPWLEMKSTVDRLIQVAEDRVRDLDPADEVNWGHGKLRGTYLGAFSAAAVDPEECKVCNLDDEYVDCGHVRAGVECPTEA